LFRSLIALNGIKVAAEPSFTDGSLTGELSKWSIPAQRGSSYRSIKLQIRMKELCKTGPMNLRRLLGGLSAKYRIIPILAVACGLFFASRAVASEINVATGSPEKLTGSTAPSSATEGKGFVAVPHGSITLMLLGAILIPLGIMRARRQLSGNN